MLEISESLYVTMIALICVLAAIAIGTILLSICLYFKNKKIRTYIKNKITDKEIDIVLKYRKLNKEEKSMINNELNTFSKTKFFNDPLDY